MVNIPAPLLQAFSADGGGRVAIVAGAGCSAEAPTSIPLASTLALEIERRLVADGLLQLGEFQAPGDLAALATFMFKRTRQQDEVVSRFPKAKFKGAKPNEGYLHLVALIAERAVTHILSLNFDLAIQHAAAHLGVEIETVDQSGQPVPARATLVQLHGNIDSSPEVLVLRTETISNAWRGQWEQVVAQQILSAPVVLFAGLGSAAPVLTETVEMIQTAIGNSKSTFQVDIADHDKSAFAKQLGIGAERYVKGGWSEAMRSVSARLLEDHVHRLKVTGSKLLDENGHSKADVEAFGQLADAFMGTSLLTLGKIRAFALLDTDREYVPRLDDHYDKLMTAPLCCLAKLCREFGFTARPMGSGAFSIQRNGRQVASVVIVAAAGLRPLAAIEPKVSLVCEGVGRVATPPDLVLVSGTSSATDTLSHFDLVADPEPHDLVDGPRRPLTLEVLDPKLIERVEGLLNAA